MDNDFPQPAEDDVCFTMRKVALAPRRANPVYLAMPALAAGLLAATR